MKLATWNLRLPLSAPRRKTIRSHIDHEQADVWVFTETDDSFTLDYPHSRSSAAGCDGQSPQEDHWVTIWSQYPLERIETSDKKRTAAARVTPESVAPFVVYGTVLPWLGSPWGDYPSADGVAFREALSVQVADWKQLRSAYPADELFVLGDFNQQLCGLPHYYGSAANRSELEKGFESADLIALTAGNNDPVRRESAPCASIDHICGNTKSKWRVERTARWPDAPEPDKQVSDHFGVSVSLLRD